jgi:hypothetical protein
MSPASYTEYLAMLSSVFGVCAEALEPGGRMAVNVANLGRKPYRSLSADVIRILEEDLGLLLRGEIIWQKAKGAAGNCAWGTYQKPGDPVLRDLTERVIIASKGRFDRAIPPAVRAQRGLPSEATIFRDEFLEATTDVWEIAPESARRVGHLAPFPVELPQRLIDLYTYRDDVVLDPFMGAGTTAVAAPDCAWPVQQPVQCHKRSFCRATEFECRVHWLGTDALEASANWKRSLLPARLPRLVASAAPRRDAMGWAPRVSLGWPANHGGERRPTEGRLVGAVLAPRDLRRPGGSRPR